MKSMMKMTMMLAALAAVGCPAEESVVPEAEHDFATENCSETVVGETTTTVATLDNSDVASVQFRLDSENGTQTLGLRDAADVSLGAIEHAFSVDAATGAFVADSTIVVDGTTAARQTSRYRVSGETTHVVTTTQWEEREIDLTWAIRLDGVIPYARMSTKLADGSTGEGVVRKVDGTYRVLELFAETARVAEPDDIQMFLAEFGYPVDNERAPIRRLMRVATDENVIASMNAAVALCDSSSAEQGRLALSDPASTDAALECEKGGGSVLSSLLDEKKLGVMITVFDGGVGPPLPAIGAKGAGGFGASGAGLAVAIGTAAGVTTGAGAIAAIVVGLGVAFAIGAAVDAAVGAAGADGIANAFGDLVLGSDPARSDAISSFYGSGAKSTGDPHLQTLDGEAFNFHGTGDFVLARAETGEPFELQTRQAPVNGACPGVAINDGFAAAVGAHTFEVTAGVSTTMLIDGQVIDILPDDVIAFDDGTRLSIGRRDFVLEGAAGDSVYVQFGGYISLYVDWASGRAASGLLGNNNGIVGDDFGLPLGTVATFAHLHDQFAEAHRVNAQNSLFTYANGEGPDDFIVAGYPEAPLSVADLSASERDPAEAACLEAGVEGEPVLTNCILDLACTSDEQHDALLAAHQISGPATSAPILSPLSLEGWTQQGDLAAGSWEVGDDGQSVVQTVNGEPTFFVSPDEYIGVRLEGTLDPILSDDDLIGFVFGYQAPLGEDVDDTYDTFVVTWKAGEQGTPEGLRLLHVHGSTETVGNDAVFWESTATDIVDVLDADIGEGTGWRTKPVRFSLLYTQERISVSIDGEERLSLNAADSPIPFESGRFGFFNFSQANTRYADFAVGAPTAEPSRTVCTLTYSNAAATDILLDTVWGAGCTTVDIERSVNVSGGTLEILPGTTVRFAENTTLRVYDSGQLLVEGTPGEPISLIGTEAIKGHWGGVAVETNGLNNRWAHVNMRHTGATGFQFENKALTVTGPSTTLGRIAINNCTFEQLGGPGVDIWVGAELDALAGNTFRDIDGAALRVPLSDVSKVLLSNDLVDAGADAAIDVTSDGNDPGLTESATWPAHPVPYRFDGQAFRIVGAQTVLTIAPGATLRFSAGGALDVTTGAISAVGTAEAPIVFDAVSVTPGGWQGVFIRSDRSENLLEHVVVDNAGAPGFQFETTAIIITGDGTTPGTLTLRDSTVSNSAGSAVLVRAGGMFTDENNTYVNNTGIDVIMP